MYVDPIRLVTWTQGLFLFAAPLLLYFLPSVKGLFRPGVELRRLFMVNLLLGWTVVGWLVAIVIAEGGGIPPRPEARPLG